ncbi:glycosyltransferase family 2 protein [Rhizobium sp. BR 315]|uniref:glycosyltransferase family 2 protein n=1 Tax=Rhizobium sp. BR 315 TaxID=3040014 RepID=UPI003D32D275
MTSAHIDTSDLSIVIPAFNEEKGIGVTLDQLLETFHNAEIIVIDDHSHDATFATAAARPGVRVLRHAFNRGQGASLKTGMRTATRDYVAWFDADNEHRPEDLARCYSAIRRNELVAVIGQRDNGASNLIRGVGKGLIRLVGRGLKIHAGHDLNCGLRIFRREMILPYCPLIPNRFSSSLVTTLVMIERRYPIAFEQIRTAPRIGQSTVRLKDGFEAMLALLRAVLLFAPMRFFMPIGLGLTAIGFIYSMLLALIEGRGVPLGGSLVFAAGLFCMAMGLVTDQLSQLRLNMLPDTTPIAREATAGAGPSTSTDREQAGRR